MRVVSPPCRAWRALEGLVHCHALRNPRRVIPSIRISILPLFHPSILWAELEYACSDATIAHAPTCVTCTTNPEPTCAARVIVSVRLLPPRATKWTPTSSALHWLHFEDGDFPNSAAFGSYVVRNQVNKPIICTGLLRPGPLALCILKSKRNGSYLATTVAIPLRELPAGDNG